MKDWPLDGECERFKTTIPNSGLSTAAKNSMLKHDRVVISAFVERLYPETDTFHMSFGEMTITPNDVRQIFNLNDHGVVFKYNYIKQLSWEQLYDLCKKCFGWDKETSYIEFNRCFSCKTRQFNMSQLIKMFKGTSEKENQGPLSNAEVDAAATAYLLCVLGCVIFPNASGNRVDANLLQLLHPLNKVADYSWGTTCLEFLMEELRNASRLRTSQIDGNVSLFQTWIYDHYPSLKLADVNTQWEKGTPRGTKYKFTIKEKGAAIGSIEGEIRLN
ncbi:protein MAIN-LIKE 2-like [Papaver somniferum]|uniref:protein MAIN-LIKE 2-like n=1 Tax=Papaver somniferum TaxID=3469 RepID=UPI000E701AFA|nr:protein MAIN-LIKE 2-like [Papaver somniferum]